jgi:hypothetical protein
MALTNAEKQARWRERNLKNENGTSCALSSYSTPAPGARRNRIACHKGCSVTSLINEWAASAERRITLGQSPEAVLRRAIAATTRVRTVTSNHNNRCTEMSDQTTLETIARSRRRKNLPLICRAAARICSMSVYRVVMV